MLPDGWHIVRDFMEVLADRGLKTALYRGQARSEWAIVPSIYRGGAGISHPSQLKDWKRRAARFASPLPRDEIEWLVLAQHYGLATALLDWTTSPLVALYFACDGEEDADGCVWWVHRASFEDPDDTLLIQPFAPNRPRPLLINAVGRNARSTAQDSFLSLHTRVDFQAILAERIFNVPASTKSATLDALSKLGFDGERLHFDITKLVSRFKSEQAGRRTTI